MRKLTTLAAFAAVLLFIGTGCEQIAGLDTPTVTTEAISSGATLRLTWTAITDAEGYKVTTDDTTITITTTSCDLTVPTSQVEVIAYSGSTESDPWTLDCAAVVTSSVAWYGISDPEPTHPSGLGFLTDGTAQTYSLTSANYAKLDWYMDDVNFTPAAFVNPGDHNPAYNDKVDVAKDAGSTDFDALTFADLTGYTTQKTIAVNGLYMLWMSADNAWDVSDHFAKAQVTAIDGAKVTVKFGYQKVGGLRWLVN